MKQLSDVILLEHLDLFLASHPIPEDLWVLAYGSLLWNPELNITKTRSAHVDGFQRGFNLLSTVHRGTPEQPGLVLSLRRGGSCAGLVYKVSSNTKIADFKKLWLREMVTLFYQPRWIDVSTPQGNVYAIAFIADPKHPQYVEYDVQTTAKMISQAHGGRGANIDYFHNTYARLQTLDIQDNMMDRLAKTLNDG